ncbi:MAG: AMP-binding protein [Oscillospiraceae bacterium]|nr:AMP-binding protein [Oscillospiraceae bacterium]
MSYQLKEVADRIRTLREIAGYSQKEMAEKAEVSLEEYVKLEEGKTDFGFTFIYKCADIFGVDMKDLLEGNSPNLSLYTVTRKGEGMRIVKNTGFIYDNLAPRFKNKVVEPFYVTIPYTANAEPAYSSHEGQEIDVVIKGKLCVEINGRKEILGEGDTIYYNSSYPHALTALGGKDCKIYAFVVKTEETGDSIDEGDFEPAVMRSLVRPEENTVANHFIKTKVDKNGVLQEIKFKNENTFNFAFDCVDKIANKNPDKLAMMWVGNDKSEHRFTFRDMKRYSNMTANYFESLGIKKGDRVMLILKRHYQFWFSILALHKIGAIVIPATNQLVEHDLTYRFKAAGVSAIVCTSDGDVANQVELACKEFPDIKKISVGNKRAGWSDFNSEMALCSDVYNRKNDTPCGDDPMLMFFTSGTTGYPKIATHSFKYALGHYITAKYWHNVNPNGLHFTISDTGWGKALWGKLYGQWLCEAGVFTYDFDRFNSDEILPMFKKYNITTFCAPPTMYRFFIKEDLSKYDLSSIEYATTAGEALNPEVYHQFYKATGLKIMEGFGQTETTLSIANLVGTTPKIGSMGKPTPLYDVVLLNAEGEECKNGETGEICIRTNKKTPCGLFLGYYQDEEKTKDVWYDGFYHTGDQATRDEEGYLWYVGRIDDVIKSSGYRIGPFEIESVIMELPYVLECAVTAAPDPVRGQVVKATIVLTKGTEGSDDLKKEIQNYVKTHTAPYKYPRIVEFVNDLPKTISGKIRRVEIRQNDNK